MSGNRTGVIQTPKCDKCEDRKLGKIDYCPLMFTDHFCYAKAPQTTRQIPVRLPYTVIQLTPWNFRIRLIGMFLAGIWASFFIQWALKGFPP
jgi:hypothetical protein